MSRFQLLNRKMTVEGHPYVSRFRFDSSKISEGSEFILNKPFGLRHSEIAMTGRYNSVVHCSLVQIQWFLGFHGLVLPPIFHRSSSVMTRHFRLIKFLTFYSTPKDDSFDSFIEATRILRFHGTPLARWHGSIRAYPVKAFHDLKGTTTGNGCVGYHT